MYNGGERSCLEATKEIEWACCSKREGKTMNADKRCALCGKDHTEVKRLILGKHGGICPTCVYRCLEILQQEAQATPTTESPAA